MRDEDLITEEQLFPRSEYYTRFRGTTAFAMNDPDYWGTYHRSESTRFFSAAEAKDRKLFKFSSPCAEKPTTANSFHAHTGGFLSPFSTIKYKNTIKLSELTPKSHENIRDKLLLYKRQMAEKIVDSFEEASDKFFVKIKKKGARTSFDLRPIVYYENNYPCVLIKLPILSTLESNTPATAYWALHPKPLQRLLMACFIAFLNVEAKKNNIPIETVIRSSFGHNLSSVCETENTFRINVGLIPQCYAELMGNALSQLNAAMRELTNSQTPWVPFTDDFYKTVDLYNAIKLKKAISSKALYKKLIDTDSYRDAETSKTAFEKLYEEFCKKNKMKEKKGKANFVPVKLQGEKIWEVLYQAGNCKGSSVLAECFRENKTVDWFASKVMQAIYDNENNNQAASPIETALYQLLSCLQYGQTASMDYERIESDLEEEKFEFDSLSFKSIYKKDSAFDQITRLLFEAFNEERPNEALYSALERCGSYFLTSYRGSEKIQKLPSYGSDSEFSDDCSDEDVQKPKFRFYHRKLRVCSGMKAIVVAHYAALSYLHENLSEHYRLDVDQMYYEVKDALTTVPSHELIENKVRANQTDSILHFDLNHCNSSNSPDNKTLAQKLAQSNPYIVVLDYTSSTLAEVKAAAKKCLSNEGIEFVMMVDSGLKNNQGGQDYNPYGEVRVMTRNKNLRNHIITILKGGLSNNDKLSPEAHEMVRACKRRGLAPSFLGLFKTKEIRFQPIEPPADMEKDSSQFKKM